MTYEPGTADIFTTGDVPFPGDVQEELTDEQVLAGLARRILGSPSGCALETTYTHIGETTVYLDVPRTRSRLSPREYEVLGYLAAGRGMWLEAPT